MTDIFRIPETWVHVTSVAAYEAYEWDELHAYYDPEARIYYWLSDSGCSCNSWGDYIRSISDFENGDKDALRRAIIRYCDAHTDDRWFVVTANDKTRALADVSNFNYYIEPGREK